MTENDIVKTTEGKDKETEKPKPYAVGETLFSESGGVRTRPKERFIVLDFLPNGHPFDRRPIHLRDRLAQVLSKELLVLLEIIPTAEYAPKLGDCILNDDGSKLEKVVGRIPLKRLTNSAKSELKGAIEQVIDETEARFIKFFNESQPLTMRQHSLELLPGIGKKHMWAILETRRVKPFESFKDIRERIKLISDPRKALVKRILIELDETSKYYLFVKPPPSRERQW